MRFIDAIMMLFDHKSMHSAFVLQVNSLNIFGEINKDYVLNFAYRKL